MGRYLDKTGVAILWDKINEKLENFKYETLQIFVETDNGVSMYVDLELTINGESEKKSVRTNTVQTFKIPAGSQYSVKFGWVNNYVVPKDELTYTAAGGVSVLRTYTYKELISNVYIVDTTGNLHTVSSWSKGSNCTGIALINDNVRIIIAPTKWYCFQNSNDGEVTTYYNGVARTQGRSAYGGQGTLISNVTVADSESEGMQDYNGETNTINIINAISSGDDGKSSYYVGAPAAEFCKTAYSNGYKGVGEWYLPSMGEMNEIVNNLSEIEEAISKVSGHAIVNYDYSMIWTSTQYDDIHAWYYDCQADRMWFGAMTKSFCAMVRPICKF